MISELKANKKVTRKQLENVGFKFVDGVWEYRHLVYKKELELLIRFWLPDEEDDKSYVHAFIVNKRTNETYAGYYNRQYGVNEINNIIDKNTKSTLLFLSSKGILILNKSNRKREKNILNAAYGTTKNGKE